MKLTFPVYFQEPVRHVKWHKEIKELCVMTSHTLSNLYVTPAKSLVHKNEILKILYQLNPKEILEKFFNKSRKWKDSQ